MLHSDNVVQLDRTQTCIRVILKDNKSVAINKIKPLKHINGWTKNN